MCRLSTRSASVECCVGSLRLHLSLSFLQQVGEDYLSLLPESLQFISELLEDDSELVATKVAELVNLIEELSGEEIGNYLG